MNETRVKHLEFIQAVITRLAHDSFLYKGWAITAWMNSKCFILASFIVPSTFGWIRVFAVGALFLDLAVFAVNHDLTGTVFLAEVGRAVNGIGLVLVRA